MHACREGMCRVAPGLGRGKVPRRVSAGQESDLSGLPVVVGVRDTEVLGKLLDKKPNRT
jgi:hypothetical protein